MKTYKMEDGTVVNIDNAQQSWEEASDWDGRNHISRPTGSQWEHQTLYRSAKGRYYLVHESNRQGTPPHAEFITPAQAAAWLTLNGRDLPPDLVDAAKEVTE